ncbi:MAG: FkbM family methyltransferase [Myxococcales bacterium]|nr:FkbM family methyltransferase [Myxococcales bacterium]
MTHERPADKHADHGPLGGAAVPHPDAAPSPSPSPDASDASEGRYRERPSGATAWERWSPTRRMAYRLRKLAAHPRPLRLIASRALWACGVSERFVSTMPRGFRMRFYPSSVSAALWADPRARSTDEDFVCAVLRPGDRYIDAGANVGQLALAAATRVGAAGEVVAVEAHPRIYRYLEGNVALNPALRVVTIHRALGDHDGAVTFSDRHADDQNHITEGRGVDVPMSPLDALVPPAPTRLLKLDVEGFELPVLQGAAQTLSATELVYCELSEGNCARFGYAPVEVETLLLDAGFVFVRPRGDGTPVVTERPYFASLGSGARPATGFNLIAAKPRTAPDAVEALSRLAGASRAEAAQKRSS